MSADQTFIFGNYKLRPAGTADLPAAVAWTAADADHAGRTRPEFWIEQTMGKDSYMLEDHEGPLFFFKLHRLSISAVELHCQFPPASTDAHQRERVQEGIIKGFEWLEGALMQSKVREVFFDSTHLPLRSFAVRRLGFTATNGHDRLSKTIGGA